MESNKVILIIMDGWGLAEDPSVSAIEGANTPYFDRALQEFPFTRLEASGLAVGLPEGQMGNSEVGHMNIGAGRVVFQDLVRINQELETGDFGTNETYRALVNYCKTENKRLHLLGLLSDGGVHSSIAHLKGILAQLAKDEVAEVAIHCFMDGRDTSPTGGLSYLKDLQTSIEEHGVGQVASLIGRYYAMDRDKRWPRVKLAYDLLVKGKGETFQDPLAAIQSAYDAEQTDEFVSPRVIVDGDQRPVATIQPGDAILFYNFRTDRGRQLTQVLTQKNMPDEGMETLSLHYATMTQYDESFQGVKVLYHKPNLKNGLGEQLALLDKKQVRIAETEKYAHVTYFFNGGREEPMAGERHLLC
ncbi:MAG: 2,3-bisphosphoglycerate-independent phosphoglycerate mutase, partial [Bacteroidota bacterium]